MHSTVNLFFRPRLSLYSTPISLYIYIYIYSLKIAFERETLVTAFSVFLPFLSCIYIYIYIYIYIFFFLSHSLYIYIYILSLFSTHIFYLYIFLLLYISSFCNLILQLHFHFNRISVFQAIKLLLYFSQEFYVFEYHRHFFPFDWLIGHTNCANFPAKSFPDSLNKYSL